ncbi:MAG: L-seryl-tRNA(Sec) selenium transferase [bacterium]|nr:L-seryl-tRNA(Sec) selenium transferase [bacterium]
MKNKNLRNIPCIERLLEEKSIHEFNDKYNNSIIPSLVKNYISEYRQNLINNKCTERTFNEIVKDILEEINLLSKPTLKPVINATGIILHTNLGRSPLASLSTDRIDEIITNYCNLEFNLSTGKRGSRHDHITDLLKTITGAEDAIVVNNNAAAIVLTLRTLSDNKEVIISRGELIEIGGSFRIHEIIETSGAVIKEVGATNKTHLSDYEKAITPNTGVIFKAHKSNYTINGFSKEISINDLSGLCKKHDIPLIHDIGSGLLYKLPSKYLKNEPDVSTSINLGVDIVTFSTDKLLGGPQGGIIVGKKKYVEQLKKSPLMRALRPGKITISILASLLRTYIETAKPPIIEQLSTPLKKLEAKSKLLSMQLSDSGIYNNVIPSKAECGGGTLPNISIDSYAIHITEYSPKHIKLNKNNSKTLYNLLLSRDIPIVSMLRKGCLVLDILTLHSKQFEYISKSISDCFNKL